MSYKEFPVGSVVYFLHKEKVLPAQVYEKVVRTSMEGSKSTYHVKVRSRSRTPTQDGFSLIELDPEVTDVFQTPEGIKQFMVVRATEAISSLVGLAVQASSVFENVVKVPESEDNTINDPELNLQGTAPPSEAWKSSATENVPDRSGTTDDTDDYAEVDLGNGQKARLKL